MEIKTPVDLQGWITFLGLVFGWIITATIGWQRITSKVNGLGGRVKKIEESQAGLLGRADRMEREISEYRRDAQEGLQRMTRVEKGQESIQEEITQGNLALGAQLHSIEKLIHEQTLHTQTRLVRLETVAQIEKKIGPIKPEG